MEANKHLSSLLKIGVFSLPALGIAYLGSKLYNKTIEYKNKSSKKAKFLEDSSKFIEKHDLVPSELYKTFRTSIPKDMHSFLEIGVLRDLKGFDFVEVFYERSFYEALMKQVDVSPEEKKKLEETAKLYFFFVPNKHVQKQAGIVHSGAVFALLDNMCGIELAAVVNNFSPIVTAFLNTTNLKPIEVDKQYVAIIEVDKIQGRKTFLKGKIVDLAGEVYTTMETLFVTIETKTLSITSEYRRIIEEKQAEREKQNAVLQAETNVPVVEAEASA